jgi:hypothetical protein
MMNADFVGQGADHNGKNGTANDGIIKIPDPSPLSGPSSAMPRDT